MTNPETGKPKGFGFADYADADQAASAVRNLNDFEIQGRKIRVDWPHNQDKDDAQHSTAEPQATAPTTMPLPPLPLGIDLPPNLKCTDAISNTLNALPPQQLLEVLAQMKSLAVTDPIRATELLRQAPQLSYAIFQALILMGLVDPKILAQVVEQTTRAQPVVNMAPISLQLQPPQQAYAGYPPQTMPNPQIIPPRPPQPQYQPPQVQQLPSTAAAPMSQEEMIRQVLAMDQRTIDSLPPTERIQIIQLRQQLGVR